MKNNIARMSTIAVILILVVNLILLSAGKISELVFWIVIIGCAVFTYKVLPNIKKQ